MKTYCCYCGGYLKTLKGDEVKIYYYNVACSDCREYEQDAEKRGHGPLLYLIRKMIERVHSS